MEHYRDLVDLWERYIKEAAKGPGGKALRAGARDVREGCCEALERLRPRLLPGPLHHVNCYQYFRNVTDTFALIDEQAASAG